MKDVRVNSDLVDHLECDVCGSNFKHLHIYLICKWDTEINEYYLSEILCPNHVDNE